MYYYIAAIVVMIVSLIVQGRLKSLVKKYSKIPAASGKSSNQIVREMLQENDVAPLLIKHKDGDLTDCYSPKEGIIYLSDTTYEQNSIAAIAIAAHECGHAVQDSKGMFIYRIRQLLAPAAGICSRAGVYIVFIGLMISYYLSRSGSSEIGYWIMNIGIWVYMVTFLFYLVMLPVERDASRRGIKAMKEMGWVSDEQLSGAKKVLRAAGDTYAVALASSAVTLLRLLSMRGRRRN